MLSYEFLCVHRVTPWQCTWWSSSRPQCCYRDYGQKASETQTTPGHSVRTVMRWCQICIRANIDLMKWMYHSVTERCSICCSAAVSAFMLSYIKRVMYTYFSEDLESISAHALRLGIGTKNCCIIFTTMNLTYLCVYSLRNPTQILASQTACSYVY